MSVSPPPRQTLAVPHRDRDSGRVDITLEHRPGKAPGILWLSGFMSDMSGGKAMMLDTWAAETGYACTRFDYSGHGVSDGDIRDGTIGQWLSEAQAVFKTTNGPQIVVGSSMGGYLSLLMTLAERQAQGDDSRIAGLVLIAPAVDMTERRMWDEMRPEDRDKIQRDGFLLEPTPYSDQPYIITHRLIEEGRRHLLKPLGPLDLGCPVHILQGRLDEDVPPHVSTDLAAQIFGDVTLELISTGDHRLSRPEDLDRLVRCVAGLVSATPS
ncbi:MAG: alpha/beta hydrolase [Pseudomonadota bacterium]